MSDDWYRRKTWTETDQEEFLARLGRCRKQANKAQYLRIQALHLEEKYPAASLELLQRIISEFPDHFELAQTYVQMARCQIALSDPDAAVLSFRKALAREVEFPSMLTHAYLDFPVFVVVNDRRDLFPEVDALLSEHASRLTFPVDHYKFNMCRALIADHRGDSTSASQHATAALSAAAEQHSGFRYHPEVGLVKKQDKTIQKKLAALAAAQQ